MWKGPQCPTNSMYYFSAPSFHPAAEGEHRDHFHTVWAWMRLMLMMRSASGCYSSEEQLTSLCSPRERCIGLPHMMTQGWEQGHLDSSTFQDWESWAVTWIVLWCRFCLSAYTVLFLTLRFSYSPYLEDHVVLWEQESSHGNYITRSQFSLCQGSMG